jgi:hypothetical protein
VPVRAAGLPAMVKMGMKVTAVLAYSVFANSTSVVCGINWSVLEAMVVTAPFSVRRIELLRME